MHFFRSYLISKWPPGGHVEFLVIATPPDPTIDADTKPSAMNLVGPVGVHS